MAVKDNSDCLRQAAVIQKLPDLFGRNVSLPVGLPGATIIQIGTPSDASLVEGGGLVIDYQPITGAQRRVVFGGNDTAMWVVEDFAITPES